MTHRRRPPPGTSGRTWKCPRCGKRAYSTWSHAQWDAQAQRDRYRERRRERPYWSPQCGAFHIGSKPKKRKQP